MDEPVSRAVAEESRRSPPLDFGNTLQVKPSALSVVDQINSLTLSAPGLSSSLSKNSQIIGNNVAYNDAMWVFHYF